MRLEAWKHHHTVNVACVCVLAFWVLGVIPIAKRTKYVYFAVCSYHTTAAREPTSQPASQPASRTPENHKSRTEFDFVLCVYEILFFVLLCVTSFSSLSCVCVENVFWGWGCAGAHAD